LATSLRQKGCEIRLFAGGDALEIVGADPELVEIPSLRFHRHQRAVSPWLTLKSNLPYAPELFGMNGPVSASLDQAGKQGRPDLVISDFEPFLPRWATKNGIPWMSIDHQHALTDTLLPKRSVLLGLEGRVLGRFVEWLVPSKDRIVSSFHHFRAKPGSSARFVGCFLRQEVLEAIPSDRGHVCVYLKDPDLLDRVAHLARSRPELNFEIWTDSVLPLPPNATRKTPHPVDFLQSLSSCHWLLTTAGNQLLGEALRLEKPILAIPAPGQTEQIFNALALVDSGCGDWCQPADLTSNRIDAFLASRPAYAQACKRRNADPDQVDGTAAATNFVLERLRSARQDQDRLGSGAVIAGPMGSHDSRARNVPVGRGP